MMRIDSDHRPTSDLLTLDAHSDYIHCNATENMEILFLYGRWNNERSRQWVQYKCVVT
jgi:hypothetical protein